MNWRRGLFRAWLVLSIAWVVVLEVLLKVTAGIWFPVDVSFRPAHLPEAMGIFVVFIIPPIGVFLVGLVLVWVSVGFRRG